MGDRKPPTRFTQQLADQICSKLADGLSVRKIAIELQIERATIRRWRDTNEEFRSQYAHAREEGMDVLVDEIIEIADDSSNDTIKIYNDEGEEIGEKANSEWINRSRLRVDARKWSASKIAPKVYGDKLELGGKGGGPIQFALIKDEDE